MFTIFYILLSIYLKSFRFNLNNPTTYLYKAQKKTDTIYFNVGLHLMYCKGYFLPTTTLVMAFQSRYWFATAFNRSAVIFLTVWI